MPLQMSDDRNNKTDPVVKSYIDAFQLSADYVEPQWELSTRLYQLWRGKLPSQLDGTFSKIMVNAGHSLVQDRLPKLLDNNFGSDELVSCIPRTPLFELFAPQAEAWLRYMLTDESEINMKLDAIPTYQSALIMGTGYRMPHVKHLKIDGKWTPKIISKDIDFFQILPAPGGGLINPMDRWSAECMPYFFYVDWWTDDQIKALKGYKGFNEEAVTELFKKKPESDGTFESVYADRFNVLGGVSYGGTKDDWRSRMNDIEGISGRRRVVMWFQREKLTIIAQDFHKIYDGPNPMPNGLLPLVTYKITPDFKNHFGISSLEMVEDMLIALMMNFNYRLDHLARTMFPTKWIRTDVMGGRPESEFYDRPYAVHEFPQTVRRIQDAMYYDRAPELTPQTFLDEDRMKMFIQDIGGTPNYSKGAPSQGTIENRTATGIVSLIRQAEGRITTESLMMEHFGLSQECRLLLALAEKNILEDMGIRITRPEGGFQWTTIEADALADQYTIKTHGTKYMSDREQSFQKMMALYPLWNGDPHIDQFELRRLAATLSGVTPRVDRLVMQPQEPMQAEGEQGQGMSMLGGQSGTQDMSQRTRGMQNRNTVQAGSGQTVSANRTF